MHIVAVIVLIFLAFLAGPGAASPPSDSTHLDALKAKASQGDVEAQNSLGEWYAKGTGVQQDYAQARAWYEKAATQGHPLAQNNLAELYFAGLGGSPDYVRAYMWVTLAAQHMQGEEKKEAEQNRDDVAQRMTPAQITEAKRLSEQCKSKKFKGC